VKIQRHWTDTLTWKRYWIC